MYMVIANYLEEKDRLLCMICSEGLKHGPLTGEQQGAVDIHGNLKLSRSK